MMGHRQVEQAALFYEFSLEGYIPADHLLRSIDRFVELGELRRELSSFYSTMGRPSVDPELMIRMLIVGYCFGIRSERRLCEEVHLNLAYRWFCRLGLDGRVPDHSTFSKNRHGRFRQSDLLRRLFETVLRRCINEGLVGGEGFAVDASLIKAEANRIRQAEVLAAKRMIERSCPTIQIVPRNLCRLPASRPGARSFVGRRVRREIAYVEHRPRIPSNCMTRSWRSGSGRREHGFLRHAAKSHRTGRRCNPRTGHSP